MTALSPPPGFAIPLQQSPQRPQVEKSKRPMDKKVSWATGEKLCQIRLFAAEDAPILSGSVQDQLQAKQARNLHIFNSTAPTSTLDAPPGFGGVPFKSISDHSLAAIVPQIKWRPPSTVSLDQTWHVMAGGASLEIGLQKQRELRILEAVYPRPSSIPESPGEPVEAQESYDDSLTPQIPLVPLEEEDLPDGSDMSSLSSGPRFLLQGSSGQVAGVQTISANATTLANGRPEKVTKYIGDNLPVATQENLLARKDSAWRDPSPAFTPKPSFLDHAQDLMVGRAPLTRPLLDVHTLSKHNGVEPDVAAAAAAAAYAALKKSQEMGSMIDNELLIQILSDPALLHSLSSKSPFSTANSKLELSSSINLNGASRGPEKVNQLQAMNGVIGSGNNHWISTPSTSYMVTPGGGQKGNRPRNGESYVNADERLQRTTGSDERPITVGNGQLYTDPEIGRVVLGTIPRPTKGSDVPPGFSIGKSDSALPPGYGSKTASQQGAQTVVPPQVGTAVSPRPLSRLDEQYYKSLIMQHGCKSADDDDHGRALLGKGNAGVVRSSVPSAPELKRWYGREQQLDVTARLDKTGRERRDSERNATTTGSAAVESAGRAKSRKVCIYFGTPRGCRNGDNCTFVHELSEQEQTRTERVRSALPHLQYAKRLKVDG